MACKICEAQRRRQQQKQTGMGATPQGWPAPSSQSQGVTSGSGSSFKFGGASLSSMIGRGTTPSAETEPPEQTPPTMYDPVKVQALLDKFLSTGSMDDFFNLLLELGTEANKCWGSNPGVSAEILKAAPCFKSGCYQDVPAKLVQILCTPGWKYDGSCHCSVGQTKSGHGGPCTGSGDCAPPLVCKDGICTDPPRPPSGKNPWYVTQEGAPCIPEHGLVCDPSTLECVDGKCQKIGSGSKEPPATGACSKDADCPEGYICQDGKCVIAPKEKQPVTWLWWLLAIVAVGGVGTAVYLGTRDEDEEDEKPKTNPTGRGRAAKITKWARNNLLAARSVIRDLDHGWQVRDLAVSPAELVEDLNIISNDKAFSSSDRNSIAVARSVIEDMTAGLRGNDLIEEPVDAAARITRILGDSYDYESGDEV